MALYWVLGLTVLAAVQSASVNRIVGGDITTIDKYPSIVQVEELTVWSQVWGQSCGANILNTRHLLSAAHCFGGFQYDPRHRRIRSGSTYTDVGGQITYVEHAFNHPNYGLHVEDADITVVRLLSSLVYSPVVQQATIVAQGSVIPDNVPVVHAGWGKVYAGGPISPVLRDVTVYTINRELCRQRYASQTQLYLPVTENMICAGILDVGGRDACQNDSGGPLYYQGIVVGIVSWGIGCGHSFYPGVNTNVASYTNWVVATVNS